MVLSWEGWTAAGSIAAIFGAIIAVFAQALHAVSLLSPGSLPPPRPRLRPSDVVAAEEAEAHALQQFRAAVNGWLENLVDQVRELRMALLPAEGETAEVLWDRLRDGSMTVKEILTALRDLQQETRDDLIALRGHLDSPSHGESDLAMVYAGGGTKVLVPSRLEGKLPVVLANF
ncbi:hypothetical protein HG530_000769 [Fusarium avenaceum]|nr:hypothetical protein HG530_000769 [Fusarium avenaceum]